MDQVFAPAPLAKPGFFLRLFRMQPKQNAFRELMNLLATKPLMEVSLVDVYRLSLKYHVNMADRFSKEMKDLYSRYYLHCLSDRSLTADEVEHLKHLKALLGLPDKVVAAIHDQGATEVFRAGVSQVLADGKITPEESSFLERLRNEVQLSDELATKILAESKTAYFNEFIEKVSADERLTPAEEHDLELLSNHLGVEAEERTKAQLQRYKRLWLIENGQAPELQVEISLQNGEVCYFTGDVQWYEQRTVTQRVNYQGPTARIRIMKGVYYRVGSIAPQRVSTEEWRQIDTGTIFLTNKRLIFMGCKKNTNIRLSRILAFTPYSDGVDIQKDAGRSPLLMFNTDVDVFSMILSRLLN